MQNESWWQKLLQIRLTRRRAMHAGAATAAAISAQAALRDGSSVEASGHSIPPPRLEIVDPHATAGQWTLQREADAASGSTAPSLRILPIDRAKFLKGQRFDFRVEAENVDPQEAKIEVSISNGGSAQVLRKEPYLTFSKSNSSESTWREVAFSRPGSYELEAKLTIGGQTITEKVKWEVAATKPPHKRAQNVLLFIGDGMGQGPITAARIVSKGLEQGKYKGLLEMDTMEVYGHVTTSGMDSIATDSANSASAYATGHKSVVNAMGVYPINTPIGTDGARVENLSELLKRARKMSVGLVTTSDVTDATPAAFFSHVRRRAEVAAIAAQSLEGERAPDVLMGGGYDKYLPQSTPGSSRKDDLDLIAQAKNDGYSVVTTRAELKAAGQPKKLLGRFRPGNMNVYLDRAIGRDPKVLGGPTGLNPPQFVGGPWMDQPTLWEMTGAAIDALSQNSNGFFLMVEAASIDKQEHPLDWQRAVWDLIELDKAIGLAKQWSEKKKDTLILVTADHNHSMQVVGTHDRGKGAGRAANGVYDGAGFPNFVDSNGDGFPDDPNPSRTLFIGWSNHPDHRDDFEFEKGGPLEPSLLNSSTRKVEPNPARKPDAEIQTGNLAFDQTNCVHTCDDVVIYAQGLGSPYFGGLLDNTEVFHGIVNALGLNVPA